jgi:hypothetical protein
MIGLDRRRRRWTIVVALSAGGITLLLLVASFFQGSSAPTWVQALAAWVQAILTAGAVFAAARLQDRSLERRERMARTQRLEGAASIARWCLAMYEATKKRGRPNMTPFDFATVHREEDFHAAVRALRTIPLAELGDGDLTVTVLRLEAALERASADLAAASQHALQHPGAAPETIDGANMVAKFEVEIFNAAAGVERRVAELVGRLPASMT